MMLAARVDGTAVTDNWSGIGIENRGFQYGDGLFETAALIGGRVRFLDGHLSRLQHGCERLSIPMPQSDLLAQEIAQVTAGHERGVVKVIVTRGAGGRGYRPVDGVASKRVVALYSAPESLAADVGIEIRWCTTRCARNAQLAGMKHLNRLEQVLAQAEWRDAAIAEGLMTDTEGELVSGTSSNVFLVIEGVLVTPDLRYAGVAGVMRGQVLKIAQAQDWHCEERAVWPEEVMHATEVFVTNAVRGIRPVLKLGERHWNVGSVTRGIASALGLW
jgi:4-amino-4-deoxychorismate lyase